MLKLVLASIALVASWYWARTFFSRVIDGDEKLSTGAFALRLVALVASVIWFITAVFGVLGSLIGLLFLAAVVGAAVFFLRAAVSKGPSAPERDDAAAPKTEPSGTDH